MLSTLWEVLKYGDIVYSWDSDCPEDGMPTLITYNGGHTFNVWEEYNPGFFRNVDVFSSDSVMDAREARQFAQEWLVATGER